MRFDCRGAGQLATALFNGLGWRDSEAVRRVAGSLGLQFSVHAPVWTHDWALDSGEEIFADILGAVYPGAIVLLHDGRPPHERRDGADASRGDRLPTVAAVRLLLPALVEQGYELVTVTELLAL